MAALRAHASRGACAHRIVGAAAPPHLATVRQSKLRCSRDAPRCSRDMQPRGRDALTLSQCRSILPVPRCVCPTPSSATHRPPLVEGREMLMRLAVGETRAPPTSKVRLARTAAVWFPISSRLPNRSGWPSWARADVCALACLAGADSIGFRCDLALRCRSPSRTWARFPHSKTRISVTWSGDPTGVGPQSDVPPIRSALVPSAVSASRIEIYPQHEVSEQARRPQPSRRAPPMSPCPTTRPVPCSSYPQSVFRSVARPSTLQDRAMAART